MEAPIVSVIMPVYNGERFIDFALKSIFSQEYRPLDVIVVDDGSVDATADIIARYHEARYISQQHKGLGTALNTGVEAARGEFMTFLDSDDWWAPGTLRRQIDHMIAHPQTDLVLGKMQNSMEPGATVTVTTKNFQAEAMVCLTWGAVMARRHVFDIVGPFNTALTHAVDVDFFIRAKEAGLRMDIIQEIFLYHRIHGSNMSLQSDPRDYFRAVKSSIERKRMQQKPPR
jgi:glycosyltransferase involved in cell wall biosynthesis